MKKIFMIGLISITMMPMIQGVNSCWRSSRNELRSREPRCHDCLLVCTLGLIQYMPHVVSNLWVRAKRGINSLRPTRPQRREYFQMPDMEAVSSVLAGASNYAAPHAQEKTE